MDPLQYFVNSSGSVADLGIDNTNDSMALIPPDNVRLAGAELQRLNDVFDELAALVLPAL
jgi:hypothetical protein